MKKNRTCLVAILVLAAICTACSDGGYTSREHCDYCGQTPTKAFATSDGGTSYICEKHSTTCVACGGKKGKVTRHFTSGLGIEIFVCEKCYEDNYKE